jgi:hypothetical protein
MNINFKKKVLQNLLSIMPCWQIDEGRFQPICCNPSLGLATKARACKSAGREGTPGVWENVRMNTHTLR